VKTVGDVRRRAIREKYGRRGKYYSRRFTLSV
jgi:hypothetical protein